MPRIDDFSVSMKINSFPNIYIFRDLAEKTGALDSLKTPCI